MSHCIHGFDDYQIEPSAKSMIAYNEFLQKNINDCDEFLVNDPEGQFKIPYKKCWVESNVLKAPGDWSFKILDEDSGTLLQNHVGYYFWGKINKASPRVTQIYIAEKSLGQSFARAGTMANSLFVVELDSAGKILSETAIGRGQPVIRNNLYADGKFANGGGSPFVTIHAKDIDDDGFLDFQIENGQWIAADLVASSYGTASSFYQMSTTWHGYKNGKWVRKF